MQLTGQIDEVAVLPLRPGRSVWRYDNEHRG